MKIGSFVLFVLYTILMILPLFSKNAETRKTKSLLGLCLCLSFAHIILWLVNGSYWWLLLLSLLGYQFYAIGNGILLKKVHFLHHILRLGMGILIFCLFLF